MCYALLVSARDSGALQSETSPVLAAALIGESHRTFASSAAAFREKRVDRARYQATARVCRGLQVGE